MAVYITLVVYNHARLHRNLPEWAKVFNALGTESISGIVLDGKTFWFEHSTYHEPVVESVYDTIKRYLINNCNFKYLYEEITT